MRARRRGQQLQRDSGGVPAMVVAGGMGLWLAEVQEDEGNPFWGSIGAEGWWMGGAPWSSGGGRQWWRR